MIITRTPIRISLVGGSTDMPQFYKQALGAVVSLTIDKYVYVCVNKRFEQNYRISYSKLEEVGDVSEIEHRLVREAIGLTNIKIPLEITSVADIPGSGTGLGSSSAFTVGLLNALLKDDKPNILAERAYVVEAEKCGYPVGKQDQYASAYGGMNYMTFGKNNVCVRNIPISSSWKEDFEKHALLLWTGISRESTSILRSQGNAFDEKKTIAVGKELAEMARNFYEAILYGKSIKHLAEFISLAWENKKRLSPEISNEYIDEWYSKAMEIGAWGGKLLGAGGGGFFLFLAPQYLHKPIIEATKLRKIPFHIELEGSKVIYDDGN